MVFTLWLALLVCSGAGRAQEPPAPFGVRGTVLDARGAPMRDAQVRLILDSPKGGKLADSQSTDQSGRFSTRGWIVSNDDREGDWRLEVSADEFATSVLDELFLGFGVYDVGQIYLFPPVDVTGRVLDSSHRPIAGAAVHAAPGEAGWSRYDYSQGGPLAETDEDGCYTLEGLPPGTVSIGVSAPGYADAVTRGAWLSSDGPNIFDFVLGRERTLEGRVVDPEGRPVARAWVESSAPGFWRTRVRVDEDGSFVLHGLAVAREEGMTVGAPGFIPKRLQRQSRAEADTVILERSGLVMARVQADESGVRPSIDGMSIRNCAPSVEGGCGWADSGNWVEIQPGSDFVEQLDPWTWRVSWEAAFQGHNDECGLHTGPPSVLSILLADGAWVSFGRAEGWTNELVELTVVEPRPGRIVGTVARLDGGTPVPGTTVMTNRWSVTRPQLERVTDAEGRFVFERMAPSTAHSLTVDNDLWRGGIGLIEIQQGETREVVLRVAPPPRIQGRLTINGQPPGEPVVVGLGEFQTGHVVEGGWFGLGISDETGSYSVIPKYSRRFTVVPKRRARPEDGGYRRFRSEFPATRRGSWRWQVDAPERGEVTLDLNVHE